MSLFKKQSVCGFAMLLLTTFLIGWIGMVKANDKASAASGMDCIKDNNGNPIACQGDNTLLQDSKTKINTYIKENNAGVQTKIDGLQTRMGGPQKPSGSASRPGMPQSCRRGSCSTSVNQIYTPSLLYNVYGDPRFVLQLPNFNQFVHLAVCESEDGYCEQKRFTNSLLVWDPFYPEGGLYVENFDVPSGCCRTRGQGHYGRNK